MYLYYSCLVIYWISYVGPLLLGSVFWKTLGKVKKIHIVNKTEDTVGETKKI